MKAVTIREAQSQLGELVTAACSGELIVLTDGDKQVALEPCARDLDVDTPELEAAILHAVNGSHSLFSENELREIAKKALEEHRLRAKK